MTSAGIGGIAATNQYVIVGSRDLLDSADVFTCHRLSDGSLVWTISYPALGQLDYGNSPRATPLIVENRVILLGAFGQLTAADLSTGRILWQQDFQLDFGAELPTWGFCGSPLLVERNLPNGSKQPFVIAQPGAEDASLVAFDLNSGEVLWQAAGNRASYSSFIVGQIGQQPQLIGYDESSLGGWNLKGERIWTMIPPVSGDFNVPTPLQIGERLFVTTENNFSRLFTFDARQRIVEKPQATFEPLGPDTASPVAVGDLICGIDAGLYCLGKRDLRQVHYRGDSSFQNYASIISDGKNRLLVTTLPGELLLLHVDQDRCEIKDRLQLTQQDEIYAHPAIVDDQLIIRFGRRLACLPLAGE